MYVCMYACVTGKWIFRVVGTQHTVSDMFVFFILKKPYKIMLLHVCAYAHIYRSIYNYRALKPDRYMKVKDDLDKT